MPTIIRLVNEGDQAHVLKKGQNIALVQSVQEYRTQTVNIIRKKIERVLDLEAKVNRVSSQSEPYQPSSRTQANQKNQALKGARGLSKDELPEPKTREELEARLRDDFGFVLPKDIKEKGFTDKQRKELVQIMADHRAALSLSYFFHK